MGYEQWLRLMEALRLRVKDLDFKRRDLTVRHLHQNDLASGWGRMLMP